jgi:hypothetical protein
MSKAQKKRKQNNRPDHYVIGDLNEAVLCIEHQGKAWIQTPGAPDWVRHAEVRPRRKR